LTTEMSKKRVENNFGVFSNDFKGVKYFGHSGGNEGFKCHYVGSLEGGNGIAVMTNGGNIKLVEEIVSSIASLNNWETFPLESRKESISLTIRKECYKNIDTGIELYKNLKKNNGADYNFSDENELNSLGYEFLKEANTASAIKIFNLNATEFPNSANAYDSRGEAYFSNRQYALSKSDYLKVIELDPKNQNAKEMLLKIEDALKK
jgi:tetratricopeptide (TPR) repeat protein